MDFYRDHLGVFFVEPASGHYHYVDEDTGDELAWRDPDSDEWGEFASDDDGYGDGYVEEGYEDDDGFGVADQIAEQVYSSLGRIPTDAELKRAVDNWENAEPGESYSIPGYDLDDQADRREYMSQRLNEGGDDQREADVDADLASREVESDEEE